MSRLSTQISPVLCRLIFVEIPNPGKSILARNLKSSETLFPKTFLPDLSLDTIAPNREAALEKIRQLEAPKGNVSDQLSEKSFGLPVFLEHLNDIACNENENIKFKCKIEPKNDSTLQIGNFFH